MDTVKCLVAKGVRADIHCDGVVIHKSTTKNRHKLVSQVLYLPFLHTNHTITN